jgi:hypothetical protein
MEKILFAIKTTEKYKSRVDAIFDTWLSTIDDYIFYSEHEDSERNIIKVCDDGSYGGLEIKGLNFFNLLKDIETSDGVKILDHYDWIFFVDDDTFVNKKMLNKFVKICDKTKAYGEIFTYKTHPSNPLFLNPSFNKLTTWYSGGAGLLISADALKKVDYYENYNSRHDDVSIGINLVNSGISLVNSDLFRSQPPEFWGDDDECVNEKITYHHVNESKMFKLYSLLK